MAQTPPLKLIPRNATAVRRPTAAPDRLARAVPGNPASARLESAIGNCFPGLECDLRNLERRFFPFIEVDINGNVILIRSVDSDGVDAAVAKGAMSAALAASYRAIAASEAFSWRVSTLKGSFGPLGALELDVETLDSPSFGAGRAPVDAWTALRLLEEGSAVTLVVTRDSDGASRTLTGPRQAYLDEDGALAGTFSTGELTQSLCSPWTHDFRDCGCFYWASNHPDISLPPAPAGADIGEERQRPVNWQRIQTAADAVPLPATVEGVSAAEDLPYYRVNTAWQLLNFVLDGRELLDPYEPGRFIAGAPFTSQAELEQALRNAAGVELAVVHEYLAAAYSLRAGQALPNGARRDDIRAAEAELLRIAFSEMRHVRAVNDVLRAVPSAGFQPALRIAQSIPGVVGAVQARAASQATLDRFIAIERPSAGIDGLYARILTSLETLGTDEQEQSVRSIIAEGVDHERTFRFIKAWLGRNAESAVIRPNLVPAPPNQPQHLALQSAYRAVLEDLHAGYAAGLPAGAPAINRARSAMPGAGLDGMARAVADAGFLVSFDPIDDPRFAPLP